MERRNFFMKVLLSETNVVSDGVQWALDASHVVQLRSLYRVS
jgi:hypothetical protein